MPQAVITPFALSDAAIVLILNDRALMNAADASQEEDIRPITVCREAHCSPEQPVDGDDSVVFKIRHITLISCGIKYCA